MDKVTLSQGEFTTLLIGEVDGKLVATPTDNLAKFVERWECIQGPERKKDRMVSVWVRREK